MNEKTENTHHRSTSVVELNGALLQLGFIVKFVPSEVDVSIDVVQVGKRGVHEKTSKVSKEKRQGQKNRKMYRHCQESFETGGNNNEIVTRTATKVRRKMFMLRHQSLTSVSSFLIAQRTRYGSHPRIHRFQ